MKIQVLLCLFLVFCFATAEEYDSQDSYSLSENAGKPVTVVEDEETKTTSLAQDDEYQQKLKKGFCQYNWNVFYAPGKAVRCSCMRCVCLRGKWACAFNFAYCPYYYCGGIVYDPNSQLCCCGKVYTKRRTFSCCGYAYYNTRTSKCCNFYTIKPRNANCPRYQIGIPSGKKG